MIKTKQSITFEPSDYRYPQWLPLNSHPTVKPTVQIKLEEITYAAEHGVTWEQLEQYYTVDVSSLKEYCSLEYSKGQGTLQINVIDAMVKSAVDEKSPVMLKFLANNWLGMTDKVTTETLSPTVDEQSLNDKLQSLMLKYSSTLVNGSDSSEAQSSTVNILSPKVLQ